MKFILLHSGKKSDPVESLIPISDRVAFYTFVCGTFHPQAYAPREFEVNGVRYMDRGDNRFFEGHGQPDDPLYDKDWKPIPPSSFRAARGKWAEAHADEIRQRYEDEEACRKTQVCFAEGGFASFEVHETVQEIKRLIEEPG